jgi:hypothetical protein
VSRASILRPKLSLVHSAHIAYYVALTKIADFLKAGVRVRPNSGREVTRANISILMQMKILLAGEARSDLLLL